MSTVLDRDSISEAYEDVRNDSTETNWAIFGFEGSTLKHESSGVDYEEFREKISDENTRMFGYVRAVMGDELSKRRKFALITWVGKGVPVLKRARMSTDKTLIKEIINNLSAEIQAEDPEDMAEEYVRSELQKAGGANYGTGEHAE